MSSVHGVVGEEEQPPPAPENQFYWLPDDVVIHIFTKVSDAKSLCRSFVVSRRFSLLIPLVQTVSVASTSWISNSDAESEKPEENSFLGKFLKPWIGFGNLFAKPFRYLHQLTAVPHGISLLEFLRKFEHIRSLHIEIPSSFVVGDAEPVFKWGANFSNKLESITVLQGKSLWQMVESEDDNEEEEEGAENQMTVITRKELSRRISLAVNCVKNATLMQGVLLIVVEHHQMLQSVTIVEKSGVRLCLSGDKLVELRNSVDSNTMTLLTNRVLELKIEKVRACYVPVLELPISGYVMKGVTVVKIKVLADGDDDDDDGDSDMAMLDAFEEEGGAFREAVVQILSNHKGIMRTFERY